MQLIQNLPVEILKQPRFFPVARNKDPLIEEWSNPDKQKLFCDILQDQLAGFDTCGHNRAADYLLLDFDHVLDDNGQFLTADAEKWFNYLSSIETYCELSISKHGFHFLLKPTPNKFPMVSAGRRGTLFFDTAHKNDSPKLEIFYGSKGRYCLFTGNVFQCQPNAEIENGAVADEVFQHIINEINKQNPQPVKNSKPTAQILSDSPDYDAFRVGIMLDCIVPADLPDTDWLAVQSAAKHIGIPYLVVDQWNQRDPDRYNEKENQTRWDSLNDPSYDISTLHGIAKRFGYDEKSARIQWFQLHPELKPSNSRNIAPDLKRQLDDAIAWLDTLNPDEFTADDAHNRDNIHSVALADFFGFISHVEKFFNIINQAKANARNRINEADENLTSPLDDDERIKISALADLNITPIKDAIKKESKVISSQQKIFTQNQQSKLAKEKAKANAQKRKEIVGENIQSLSDLLDQFNRQPSNELANQIRNIISATCEWRCDKQGVPISVKSTAANADLIFNYDPIISGLFGYDEFRQSDVLLKRPPWRNNKNCIGDEWSDKDDAELRAYIRRNYTELTDSKNLIRDWVTSFSNSRSFHEIREYFKKLPPWDGIPRAKKFLVHFLRADDTPYVHEVTMNWFTAAVARIFHPGCNYQTALVLHGNQGIGKSFVLERIGGKWYCAIIDNVDDPHAIDALKNTWIGEFKEMAGMRKAELNAIKSFIERSEDNRRFAYERRATKLKRHCVFAITVNDDHFLTDTTGNRRYLIVHCNSKPLDYVEGLTDDYIQQLWAEVLQHCKDLFIDGFDEKKLELSREVRIQAEEIAQQYLRDDGLAGEIKAFLDTKILPPVIWNLMTREERRDFIKNGRLVMINAVREFNFRRRSRGGNPNSVQNDVNLISSALKPAQNKPWLLIDQKTIQGNDVDEYTIYGSEFRQHICAAEIFNECFGADKRKSMQRIHEILPTLDGWSLGARIQKADPVYGDQKKPFYRNT